MKAQVNDINASATSFDRLAWLLLLLPSSPQPTLVNLH